MIQDSQAATLSVRFDADQTSSDLQWVMNEPDGDPRAPAGTNAGAMQFYQSESLALEVIGGASKSSNFSSFQIIDCCITTIPRVVSCGPGQKTVYARPSPFLQSLGANYAYPLDFSAVLDETDPAYRKITQTWKHLLNIGQTSGRWEISFNITVMIFRDNGNTTELRVFQFDPEGTVGGGTRPQN